MSARISAGQPLGAFISRAARISSVLMSSFLAALACGSSVAAAQTMSFSVISPGSADGALLTRRNAASIRDCGGEDVSPPIAWSQAPAGTLSQAIVTYDPDGGKGLGSVHWVAYDIAPSTQTLAEGAGSTASRIFVGGTNSRGTLAYAGPCPPVGDQPHHYVFSVYALDLKPGMLPPGLTRDAFFQAIKGHVLAEASIVLRYAR